MDNSIRLNDLYNNSRIDIKNQDLNCMVINEHASIEEQTNDNSMRKPPIPTMNRAAKSARQTFYGQQEKQIERDSIGIHSSFDANMIQQMFPDRAIKA